MTQERWQEVKKVLAAALERPPEERRVYLDQACAEPSLRREVQSLIDAHEQAETTFMGQSFVETTGTLKSGAKLGPYEILERIGAGGMGVVYRARDERLQREVAIKVLPFGLLTDEAARKRFRKEALALAKVSHPNIATVYDVGEQAGTDYLVMECVAGQSLADEVRSGRLPEKEAAALGTQIAAALEEAHEHGIVHRDLKPSNIMVTPKRQAKVLDFGLAKILRTVEDFAATDSVTQTQDMVGTLPYMAPEQLRGEPADARTDIHALGAVLFEVVTGKRVYEEHSAPQLTDAILHQQPVAPRALNARVSPEMERVILKCLEKEPENRYQSAKELGVDLRRLGALSAVTVAAAVRPVSRLHMVLPLGGTLLVGIGLAAGGYFYLHPKPKLTEKDSIVLADFANATGDPVFDGALRQGLSVQLEQTPFLRIISGDQITQTLRMMEQPPEARLTPDLAREVCQRTNATVEIEGTIAALGSQYVLGLNALNCQTGEVLAQEQVTADGKEKVLSALSDAASGLRSRLGESRASLKTYDVPLTQATTSSLEALQAYNQGRQAFWKGDFRSAISSLQRAVDLDPSFATAYVLLGVMYNLVGNYDLTAKNVKRAYELRDRASEYEKFAISADYADYVTRDLEKAAQFFEQWTTTYPRDPAAWIGLAVTCFQLARYDQSLSADLKTLRLNPSSFPYGMVGYNYLAQNRFEEARATIQQARAEHIEPYQASETLYSLDFLQGDQVGMTEQVAHPWADRPPGTKEDTQSATAAYSGHLSRARDLEQRAIASAKQQGANGVMAGYQVNAALLEALVGNFPEARKAVKHAGNFMTDRELEGEAAIVWALAGDAAQAQKLADELNKRFPEATRVRFGSLPAIRGVLAIRRGNAQEAIEDLRAISSHELMFPLHQSMPPMVPVYISGEAYLAAHRGAEATPEFQMIIDHPGLVLNAPIGALAHLGLGRAYAMQGDTTKARAAYQDFLALWKDADSDIPILRQAKAEYAKLQ